MSLKKLKLYSLFLAYALILSHSVLPHHHHHWESEFSESIPHVHITEIHDHSHLHDLNHPHHHEPIQSHDESHDHDHDEPFSDVQHSPDFGETLVPREHNVKEVLLNQTTLIGIAECDLQSHSPGSTDELYPPNESPPWLNQTFRMVFSLRGPPSSHV